MEVIHCRKCGHDARFDHRAPEACPECGAVYRKVEEAGSYALGATNSAIRVTPVAGEHIDVLRSETLYPTFRGFATAGYKIGLAVAIIFALGGVAGALFQRSVIAFGTGLLSALFVFLLARFFREAWLMLADLSDAAVRISEHMEKR